MSSPSGSASHAAPQIPGVEVLGWGDGYEQVLTEQSLTLLASLQREFGPRRAELAGLTNPRGLSGSLQDALIGADVFIGVSAPGILTGDDVATMAEGAVVFALANPTPEVDPAEARRTAAVVATGRSDEPNQINNVLAFPGVFRGLLDAGARHVDLEMEAAAARALADVVQPDQLNAAFIVPSVFDPAVTQAVAAAVRASVEARNS